MARRITIMLEEDLMKKLHDAQAKQIRETNEAVSFSKVINDAIKQGFKKN